MSLPKYSPEVLSLKLKTHILQIMILKMLVTNLETEEKLKHTTRVNLANEGSTVRLGWNNLLHIMHGTGRKWLSLER